MISQFHALPRRPLAAVPAKGTADQRIAENIGLDSETRRARRMSFRPAQTSSRCIRGDARRGRRHAVRDLLGDHVLGDGLDREPRLILQCLQHVRLLGSRSLRNTFLFYKIYRLLVPKERGGGSARGASSLNISYAATCDIVCLLTVLVPTCFSSLFLSSHGCGTSRGRRLDPACLGRDPS